MNLKHNVWFFKDGLDKKICNSIIKKNKKIKLNQATIGGTDNKSGIDKKTRDSKVSWIKDSVIYEKINHFVNLANKNAGWNFNIDWNEDVQFTEYKSKQYYNWHTDQWDEPYVDHVFPQYNNKIRKISCSILLNDPQSYEGGDFEIGYTNKLCNGTIDETKIKLEKGKILKQGSVIVFPSFIWHRVTPVKKGVRYSLVNWVLGPPYV